MYYSGISVGTYPAMYQLLGAKIPAVTTPPSTASAFLLHPKMTSTFHLSLSTMNSILWLSFLVLAAYLWPCGCGLLVFVLVRRFPT